MRSGNSSSGGIVLVIVVLVILPILYVLSTGPAVLLVDNGLLSEDSFEIVYYPLIWIAQSYPPIGQMLEGYVRMWSSLLG